MSTYRAEISVCSGKACHESGSHNLKEALDKELLRKGLNNEIRVTETQCNGFCAQGPVLKVEPEGTLYQKLKEEDIPKLVEEHLVKGEPVKRLFLKPAAPPESVPAMEHIPFYSKQMLIVLKNRGVIDPESLEEYIARDGYVGASKALLNMTPEQIIQEVKTSGLRGRGGAGFSTGLKWEFASKSPGDVKYALCNADEGDPGAFMDRSVLEADPHAVLEGMVIAAKAIGAHQGYIYCRAEYPLAVHRLNLAIQQAEEAGLLGRDILVVVLILLDLVIYSSFNVARSCNL